MNSNDYVNAVFGLSVPMSKFDVTRPSNFHEVLKTSVPARGSHAFANEKAIFH